MATINVWFDKSGNLQVDDLNNAKEGESVTWSIVGGTITAITQGTAFTAPPVNTRGTWTATVETTSLGEKTYNLSAQQTGSTTTKTKPPKVQVNGVVEVL